jgi:hypothetical protein
VKIVIFGLAISSSWGNGHATLWRGLARALIRRGHHVTFFERDRPYYAAHRDVTELPGGELVLYDAWDDVLPRAQRALADADVGNGHLLLPRRRRRHHAAGGVARAAAVVLRPRHARDARGAAGGAPGGVPRRTRGCAISTSC